ncbi:AraC family transcriptional regulator [Verticiella sediminum]|uniref:helix-turn-helix transcriptional regulator n=1 Tax=Verticiella sediminum TaxID=1247510 RepID=UPI0031EC3DE4
MTWPHPDLITTQSVPAAQRIAFWEASNASTLVGLRCATFDGQALEVSKRTRALGDEMHVVEIAGNAHVIERTAGLVHAHPKDAVFVSLVLDSHAFFYHADGCASVGPGDLIVYSTSQPYLFGFPGRMWQYLFDVPTTRVRALGLAVPCAPRRLAADTSVGRTFGAALRRLAREAFAGAPARPALRQALLAALEGMLRCAARAAAAAPAHLLAARSYVQQHYVDPGLDAAQVAAHCGISVRHLARLFAAQGVSFSRYLLDCRLAAAHARLVSGDAGAVAQAAYRCGFSSAAYFTRVFKARYGTTPSAAKAAARCTT